MSQLTGASRVVSLMMLQPTHCCWPYCGCVVIMFALLGVQKPCCNHQPCCGFKLSTVDALQLFCRQSTSHCHSALSTVALSMQAPTLMKLGAGQSKIPRRQLKL